MSVSESDNPRQGCKVRAFYMGGTDFEFLAFVSKGRESNDE